MNIDAETYETGPGRPYTSVPSSVSAKVTTVMASSAFSSSAAATARASVRQMKLSGRRNSARSQYQVPLAAFGAQVIRDTLGSRNP